MPDYQALRGQAGSCGWYLRQSADYRYFVQVTHDLEVESDETITVPESHHSRVFQCRDAWIVRRVLHPDDSNVVPTARTLSIRYCPAASVSMMLRKDVPVRFLRHIGHLARATLFYRTEVLDDRSRA